MLESTGKANGRDLGILMYVDDNPAMIEEFGWIYKSWILSGNWRTSDLIVVCHQNVAPRLPIDDPGVIKIIQSPVSVAGSRWEGYPFINSIACLSGEHTAHLAEHYDYLLRTDADVFLTPNLVKFRPNFPVFGRGRYAHHPEVWTKIVAFAEKIGLQHHRVFNCGHSLLASSADVLFFIKEQTRISEMLLDEFRIDAGQWPGWYRGVMTMYAAELVANHYFDQFLIYAYLNILDMESYWMHDIDSLTMHIHAIHTHDYFSKIRYREGAYSSMDISKLDRNKIDQYCHYLVVTPLQTIKQIANYPH